MDDATTPRANQTRIGPGHDATAVSVLGLGAMGQALASAFLAGGRRTTVWNRTAGKGAGLEAAGARIAATAREAVRASPITIICLLDRAAVDNVLDMLGDGVAGASIVNLSSSTPEDARTLAARVQGAGARYLDGKIMVPTPLIGTSESLVLYSGDQGAFDGAEATLRALGGEADFLGEDPGLAALFDLGMLDIFFNGMAAFLHATALVGADDVTAAQFLPYAQRIVSVLQYSMSGLAADVDHAVHLGDEDNLAMEHTALGHIVEASAARGIDTTLVAAVQRLTGATVDAGYGDDGFSRVIDILRRSGVAATSA